MYSIKAVSQATGLSVETLRAWERRYGIVAPQRDPAGRRVYRPEDVVRLRRLREATDRGHPISRLAVLSNERLAGLLSETPTPVASSSIAFVDRILEAAAGFRAAECEQALTLAIALLPPLELVQNVLHPLLREVGERWHRGVFTIAQERLVSTCVRRHVGIVLDTLDRGARGQDIVFATLPGEQHELGLLLSAVLCSSRGLKCHYLGPGLPALEIARYARGVSATIVALSIVMPESVESVPAQLRSIASEFDGEVTLWLGGAAAGALQARALPPGCVVLSDLPELERRLDLLHAA